MRLVSRYLLHRYTDLVLCLVLLVFSLSGVCMLPGSCQVILTDTTITINSLKICDDDFLGTDPDIYILVTVGADSWQTSTIETDDTAIWSDQSNVKTYSFQVDSVQLQVYDEDTLSSDDLRGGETFDIANNLNFINNESITLLTQSFSQDIYFEDETCDDILNFTITFFNRLQTSSPSSMPSSSPTSRPTGDPTENNSDGSSGDKSEKSEVFGVDEDVVLIIVIVAGVLLLLCLFANVMLCLRVSKQDTNESTASRYGEKSYKATLAAHNVASACGNCCQSWGQCCDQCCGCCSGTGGGFEGGRSLSNDEKTMIAGLICCLTVFGTIMLVLIILQEWDILIMILMVILCIAACFLWLVAGGPACH